MVVVGLMKNRTFKVTLSLLAIAAGVAVVLYAMIWKRLLLVHPGWVSVEFVVVPFARLLAIYLVWKLSRVGVVLYALATAVDVWVCAAFYTVAASLYGVAGLVLLVVVVRPYWSQMSWTSTRSLDGA